MSHQQVLDFWFEELQPAQHWEKDQALDAEIAQRFGAYHEAATKGECAGWRSSAEGRLAEIIVLDQFSRNIYRDDARSFAFDGMALVLSQELIALNLDQSLAVEQRAFAYLPYMHSESLLIHEQAMLLFEQPGMENNYQFEIRHKRIIERFGRYPHRNAILGRASTDEELVFLQEPGSSF